jgi:dihydroorotate dehydrogenase electron transfer subunit
MKQLAANILSSVAALPGVRLIRLAAPEIAAARPGQFVMVRCGEDTLLRRPISVHRVAGDEVSLLVADVGKGTAWLNEQPAGGTLDVFGPLGNGFTLPKGNNALLVAGGIGIAPLVCLADALLEQGKKVTLINGARTADCLLPVAPPHQLYAGGVMAAGLHVVNATEDGSEGFKGLATQLIKGYLDDADAVCACGPAPMYRAMAAMPELAGRDVQVSLEIMMGCGAGICYGCTIKTKGGLKQVCKDGPVFNLAELEGVDWDVLGC